MDTVEVYTHIIQNPINTTARRREGDGVLRIDFVIPVIPGIGEMRSYNIGEAGQQEITKAITGGLHITKDMPNA